MRIASPFALFAAILACAVFTAPAYAQRDRVFVASYGSDSNPCTFGSPCKTFQGALSVVAAGGEVTAIDSAGFGPVVISQSVSITSPNGVEAGIAAAAGGTAITINGGTAVSLRGLTLEGAGSGAYGIYVSAGGRIEIDNCVIRDYTSTGVYVSSSEEVQLTITNTQLSNNPTGLYLTTVTAGSLYATLDNVVIDTSTGGIYEGPGGAPAFLTIANSDFSHDTIAIFTGGQSGSIANLNLSNVVFNDSNDIINLFDYSSVALSHVYDMHQSGSLVFNGNTSVVVDSDGTNHVSLSGPDAPGSLGAYSFR
jgi:hypothetical protein